MLSAEYIIDYFGMKPLPEEGGYYVETYRAEEKITSKNLPSRYTGPRNFSTAILYLLTPDACSRLHKVKSDEIFHFYLGDPIRMIQLHPDGKSEIIEIGPDITKGQNPQFTVPKGTWQGSQLKKNGKFALLGCTVAPSFEFTDYCSADKEKLLKICPNLNDIINEII